MIAKLPENLWYIIPEETDSNFVWQFGHLLVSQNFHAISTITGENENVQSVLPIKEYKSIFNEMGTLHRSIGKDLIPAEKLWEQSETIHKICINNLGTLNDDILLGKLELIHSGILLLK